MPRLSDRDVLRISSAIAEPRRFRILKDLAAADQSMACGTIVARHRVSHATISHHLKELANAGLIELQRDGKFANVVFLREVWTAYLARISEI
jgi:DNA-binding transcriptional ArsR family regulator